MKGLTKSQFAKVFKVAAKSIEEDLQIDFVSCLALEMATKGLMEGVASHDEKERAVNAIKMFYANYMKPVSYSRSDRWFGHGISWLELTPKQVLIFQSERATALNMMHEMIKTNPSKYYKEYLACLKSEI